MTNCCVITAGPSAGKSSTIRVLAARGYSTAPEAARIVLDQAISEGDDPAEVRQSENFHQKIENMNRQIEGNLGDETVFLDRSLADNIAYRRHYGSSVPDILIEECWDRYDHVMLLERLDFKDDNVRTEDEEEAAEIHKALRETYEDLGYEVTEVPLMTVEERANFIEHRVAYTPPIH